MKTIAVIGIGIMGNGIAANFLKAKYPVIVWNRTQSRLKPLQKLGAIVAKTPQEATQKADIVFEVTANDASSRKVWKQILKEADKSKTLITCATLSVDWTDQLSKMCAKKGLTFFDMPMTGGRIGAETGNLSLLVGGNKAKLDKLKPILRAIAGNITYFGQAGSGMRFKLILNSIQGMHIQALGEALVLAKKAKLPLKTVGDFLSQRPGGVITNMAWQGYQKTPKPINFSVEWITKDLTYAKKMAGKIKLPLLDKVLDKYRLAMKKKLAQKDWTEVNRF
jgi:3-hydroxyisobutyrate dehydrogenase-like beta-hydroxyacid dehydrogenase